MKTVREWVEFLADEKTLIGLELEGGYPMEKRFYLPAEKFLIEFSGWLDDKVVQAYPMNLVMDDGTTYALLVYRPENN